MTLAQKLLENSGLPQLDEGRIEAVYNTIQPIDFSLGAFKSNLLGEEITPEELEDIDFMRDRIEVWSEDTYQEDPFADSGPPKAAFGGKPRTEYDDDVEIRY